MDKEGGVLVDRPKKEKTITIKINGKNRSYLETKTQNDDAEDKQLNKEHTYKNQKKIDYYSEIQAAATKEAEEEDNFDWILPEETTDSYMIKEYKMANVPSKKNKNGLGTIRNKLNQNKRHLFFKPVFIVVLFAILVGTSFGLIILNLVQTEKITETAEPVIAQPQPNEGKENGSEKLSLASLSTFIIQGGVFSNIEAAKQLKEENMQKGVPAQIVERDGQAFLFLGVADNLEHAKEIGGQISNKGIEVFAKSVVFDEKSLNALHPEEKRLLEVVHTFYEILATGASEGAVAGTIPVALFESAERQASILKDIDPQQIKNEETLKIKTELESAMEQLKAYKQSPNPEVLTKIQQHLLNFLAVYTSLK